MKKIFLAFLFFIFTPLTIGVSLFGLAYNQKEVRAQIITFQETGSVLGTNAPLELYSALPATLATSNHQILGEEARAIIIKNYLIKNQSPMASYADLIFTSSEKYQLDWRLIVAIAQCESNLCKKIPEGSYNCWGFENGTTHFLSWEQAFERVAKTLKEGYIDKGLVTPEQIMPKYAPPSVEKGGPWARCVSQFMEELE